jgi:hypothetical protein
VKGHHNISQCQMKMCEIYITMYRHINIVLHLFETECSQFWTSDALVCTLTDTRRVSLRTAYCSEVPCLGMPIQAAGELFESLRTLLIHILQLRVWSFQQHDLFHNFISFILVARL